VRHRQKHGAACREGQPCSCASSGHSLSTTTRILLEMTVTFSISSIYLRNRLRSAGVITFNATDGMLNTRRLSASGSASFRSSA